MAKKPLKNYEYGALNYTMRYKQSATLYMFLYTHIFNNAIKVFKWENLPDGVDENFIEYALFNFGQCVFAKHLGDARNDALVGTYIALPATGAFDFNIYAQPVKWTAQGFGYSHPYNITNSVLMRNNYMRTPSIGLVAEYVERMVDCLLAIDVNLNACKTPLVYYGDEDSIRSLQSLMDNRRRNMYQCVVNKNSIGDLKTVENNVEFKCDKFWDLFNNYKNLVYEMLGINTLPVEKRERLITGEVTSNNEQIDFNVGSMLEARKRACKEINEMYGLNISVSLRYESEETPTQTPYDDDDEV